MKTFLLLTLVVAVAALSAMPAGAHTARCGDAPGPHWYNVVAP